MARPDKKGGERLTQVIVDKGESFEAALRRFNRMVQADRVLSEARRRRFFEKPCVERKRKKAAKRRKSRKQSAKDNRE
jgi:small subunit ribosomal protein S21